jgi:hypothetical protein
LFGTDKITRTAVSERTLSLTAIATDNRERVMAVRAMLTDHFHSFGCAEVLQISADGALRERYWTDGEVPRGWHGRINVPTTAEEVDP